MKKLTIFFFLALLSCGTTDKGPLSKMTFSGINDSATYVLDGDGKAVAIMKTEYFEAGKFSVFIHRDTVELGDKFSATFSLDADDISVFIIEPTADTITKAQYEQFKRDNPEIAYNYAFSTKEAGVFNFRGEVRYDSISKPFAWKFLVKNR